MPRTVVNMGVVPRSVGGKTGAEVTFVEEEVPESVKLVVFGSVKAAGGVAEESGRGVGGVRDGMGGLAVMSEGAEMVDMGAEEMLALLAAPSVGAATVWASLL